jgi:hypothetical protein
MALEGESGRGIFYTAGQGRNFRRRKKGGGDALQRFAEALSHHGDPRRAAQEIGLNPSSGNGMLQRIRKRLGPQAR